MSGLPVSDFRPNIGKIEKMQYITQTGCTKMIEIVMRSKACQMQNAKLTRVFSTWGRRS